MSIVFLEDSICVDNMFIAFKKQIKNTLRNDFIIKEKTVILA